MLEAIVAGWEIIVRLGLAAKGRFHDVGYHGTGIASPFAWQQSLWETQKKLW